MPKLNVLLAASLFSCVPVALCQPLGSPPGTYNASQAHSGAWTATTGDPVYPPDYAAMHQPPLPGLPHFLSMETWNESVIAWHRIEIPVESRFLMITGNGDMFSSRPMSDVDFRLTVELDPADAADFPRYRTGAVATRDLVVARWEDRGQGWAPGVMTDYDVLLESPTDLTLDAGVYWCSVYERHTGPQDTATVWGWSELNLDPDQTESAVWWHEDAPPNVVYPVRDSWFLQDWNLCQTGVGAIDFWFAPVSAPCAADLAPPVGTLDLADINAFTGGFLSSEPIADLDDNGLYDLNDISDFIDSFTAGCP